VFDHAAAQQSFIDLSETALSRAPRHSAISAEIARQDDITSLMAYAPASQRNPVLLMAVLHWLVLRGSELKLAEWYPTVVDEARSIDDPALGSAVADFVEVHKETISDALSHRRTQTNEVGRCALFVAALSQVSDLGTPVVHIDIGTSAGLTLGLPRYAYRFDNGRTLGSSELTLSCSSRDAGFVADSLPTIVRSVGIDSAPLDVQSDDDAFWLQACVWPDQLDRFERLRTAIALAREQPPDVRKADATAGLASVVDEVGDVGDVVITSSWVLNYFSPSSRAAFLTELDRLGAVRDITFVFAESAARVPELPHAESLYGRDATSLGVMAWRSGACTGQALAEAHPHGYWYDGC